MKPILFSLSLTLAAISAFAQTTAPFTVTAGGSNGLNYQWYNDPATSGTFTNSFLSSPPGVWPEIKPDRTVTFHLRAQKAQEVLVNGQWPNGRATMTKESSNLWSVTVGPIQPGIWEYSFSVDGLAMIDPSNPMIKPQRLPTTSILQIRGEPPLLWDYQDVPHGTVHQHDYHSHVLNRLRGLNVYTPPGYEHSKTKFPVLYLQHGSGDNQLTWTVHGKVHWILDNLIAQGRAKPMIIVMMDGHAVPPGGGPSAPHMGNTDLFERDLLEEVMPFVEKEYRVKSRPANRAIVGLSMGGGQSLTIGLNHPDLFAWVGGFSSATPTDEAIPSALSDPSALNKKLKLLWIGDGKDDFLLQRNEKFIDTLKAHNVNYEWHLTEGNHSWPVWRNYLIDFAPKLFR